MKSDIARACEGNITFHHKNITAYCPKQRAIFVLLSTQFATFVYFLFGFAIKRIDYEYHISNVFMQASEKCTIS